ncbi:jg3966, partial [Pararge aegeria aegeria]
MLLNVWNTLKEKETEREIEKDKKGDISKEAMAATMVETPPPQLITTIEWSMMDKSKFFPLYTLSSFTVRCALYPLTLIKTQIQIQRKKEAYKGVSDAITKIYASEGVSGLYRGFWLLLQFLKSAKAREHEIVVVVFSCTRRRHVDGDVDNHRESNPKRGRRRRGGLQLHPEIGVG